MTRRKRDEADKILTTTTTTTTKFLMYPVK